jgi:hypothetical protein
MVLRKLKWIGQVNDRFAGKTVTKNELVDYLSGRSTNYDPTDLIKENTNVAKGLMINPSLPKLTRVMSRSRRAPLTGSLPSPDQVKKFESQVEYFVAEEGSDKPIQGSIEASSRFNPMGYVFYDSLEKAGEVSDRINDKRLQMSGMKESGQKIVSPDALTYTEDNFPLGGTDTAETVYRFDDPTGLYDNAFGASHKFNELPDDNVLAHTRTAQFPVVDGGKGYHLGEVQSDIYQNQRRVTKLGRAPGEELRSRSEELALREKYDNIDLKALVDDIQKRANELFAKRLVFKKNFNLEYQNAGREEGIQAGKDIVEAVQTGDRPIPDDAAEAIKADLIKKYTPKELDTTQISNLILYPKIFFDEIRYGGQLKPDSEAVQKRIKLIQGIREKFRDEISDFNEKNKIYEILKKQKDITINIQRSGKTDQFKQLPYGESTNQWVDMVLRKELAKAIDSGSEFMTIPSSDLVRKYTQGSEEGQGKFYFTESELGIVPMRLNKLAKKYDPNISLIPRQIITEAGDENVMALPITQKLIDNVMKKGLPKYAVPITGGSLGALSFVEGEQQ